VLPDSSTKAREKRWTMNHPQSGSISVLPSSVELTAHSEFQHQQPNLSLELCGEEDRHPLALNIWEGWKLAGSQTNMRRDLTTNEQLLTGMKHACGNCYFSQHIDS